MFSEFQAMVNEGWKRVKKDDPKKMMKGFYCSQCWRSKLAVKMEFVDSLPDKRLARHYTYELYRCPRCNYEKKLYGKQSLNARGGTKVKNRY